MFTLQRFEHELRKTLSPLAADRRACEAPSQPAGSSAQQSSQPSPSQLSGSGYPPAGLCVALSGGLDSTVLLAASAQLLLHRQPQEAIGRPVTLRAVHIDHSLHADSAHWARASREMAHASGVPFEDIRVDARHLPGESPEAAARTARYAALRALLRPGEVLLTAHHADDQLETILLQWLRGGGLRAVAGMAPLTRLEGTEAWHARPLLAFTREELAAWAREQGLGWLEDPSNADRRYDRNYLRHEVLPALRTRWPAAALTAGRVAGFAREALELEASVASADLAMLAGGGALDLAKLLELPEPRQRAALRAWLAASNLPVPAAGTLEALRRDMERAADDRIPQTRWPGAVVRRYRGRLYASAPDDAQCREGEWLEPTRTNYPWTSASHIELVAATGHGIAQERLPAKLQVRCRVEGESFLPEGHAHRRPLRKWLQERGVLPWRRAQLPLLMDENGTLVAIAHLAYAREFAARPGEPSWRVAWHGRGCVTEADALASGGQPHP